MADVWKYILMWPNVSQVPVLNTKEGDLAYVKLRLGLEKEEIRDLLRTALQPAKAERIIRQSASYT